METWELDSVWSPVGVKAYVTFPIDPQLHSERKPWAIMVTAEPPEYGLAHTDHFETSLIQWKNEKDLFIKFLENIRNPRKSS